MPKPEGQVMLIDGKKKKKKKAFGAVPYTNFEVAMANTIDSFRK